MKKCINENWLFIKNCADIKCNDGETVNIPHTYNNTDGQDGGGDYFRGTCIYRKTFDYLDNADKVYLEFEGVSASAKVYLNGEYCGEHDGGFSLFRIEIKPLNGKNELAVIVDNSKNDRVYPQNADFTFYGGIYRNVRLLTLPEIHFDRSYYGGNGVVVTPTVNADGSADVKVQSYTNGGEVKITLDGQTKYGNDIVFKLPSPRLWNGRKDPYLYTVKAELVFEGQVRDIVTTKFGIRSFHIDPDKGFILNGKPYSLRGVAMHQDRLGKGNAVSEEDIKEDIALIAEMGCTTVRLAHYQHAELTYNLCDEYGLVVWAEIPYISEHLDNACGNAESQLKELIIQNYNHPSIVVWGLSNEITMAHGDNPNIVPFHKKLNELAHKLDPTRLTTLACISVLSTDSPLVNLTDVLSYNHYFGWYGGKLEDNGKWFDEFHRTHPEKAIGVSEYGCENSLWHSERPEPGDYTNEYQMIYHESLIDQLYSRPYLWATHVWNMFDFAADARDEGGTHGRNNKGLVTFDRKYKKDTFYAYKARLSNEPVLHLCSKEFIRRAGDSTRITVYSNLPEVTLYINGKQIESVKNTDCFCHFDITQPNGKYTVKVVSGEYSECATLEKVEKPDPSYSFGGATVLNWFDITTPDGYFSIKDSMGDLNSNPKSAEIVGKFMAELMAIRASNLKQDNDKPKTSSGEGMSAEERKKIQARFSLLQLIKMAVPDLPKEKIIEINNSLNKIEK